MPDSVNNPHDKFFTEVFSRRESAVPFLQQYLPADLQALIDFDSYARYPGNFVDEELKAHSSDLVYQFTCNDHPAFLYMLFEHQSTPEPLMAWRLLKYMTKLWAATLKDQPNRKRLPPIIPLVLYQGKAAWNAPLHFRDQVDNDNPALTRYIPQFEYLLVDLARLDEGAIRSDLYGQLALHLLRAYGSGTLPATLDHHAPFIGELLRQENGQDMFKTVFHYLVSTVDNQDVDIATLYQTAARAGDGKIGETLMTTIAEQLIAEGRLEGETKGRLEGEAKGRLEGETKGEQKLIRRQWQLKFPGQPVPDLDHYSLEQLETIGDRLLTCNTPAEVLQGLD